MPLYEYECDNGHRFERIQKFSDPPVEKCPTCGAPARKLVSSPAIQFKGSGWYITDYARKDAGTGGAEKTDGASEAKTDAKSETKTEGKADSKPDVKADSKRDSKSETKTEPKPPAASRKS